MKRKEPEFEFIIDVPPDEDTIRRAHMVIAKALIDKYGADNMKAIVKILKNNKQ